jgi:hypothetical protein
MKSFAQEQAELRRKMTDTNGCYDRVPPHLSEIRRIQGVVIPILRREGISVESIALAIANAIVESKKT